MLQLIDKDDGARSHPRHRSLLRRLPAEQVLLLAILDHSGEENSEGLLKTEEDKHNG